MNIVVTGGAGYIGSHICKALSQRGYHPICLDTLERGHASSVKWGPLEQGDIRDKHFLDQVFTKYSIEGVIHCAAYAYIEESIQQPLQYYDNNVGGSASLVTAMEKHQIPHLIFSSSCATYGIPEKLPIDETTAQEPINPYGRTKLLTESLIRHSHLRYGILRYFNAAGSDPEGEIGEKHDPETHLIPSMIKTALYNKQPFTIYGTDYPTQDGTAVRDFVHVSDLAKAHVDVLEYLRNENRNLTLNLGSTRGYSIREVHQTLETLLGKKIPYVEKERREGDPPMLIALSEKAQAIIGWNPQYSDLKTILQTALNFELGTKRVILQL